MLCPCKYGFKGGAGRLQSCQVICVADCSLSNFEGCVVGVRKPTALPLKAFLPSLFQLTQAVGNSGYLDKYIFFRALRHGSCSRSNLCCFPRVHCATPFPKSSSSHLKGSPPFWGPDGMLGSWSLTSSKLPSHRWQSTSSWN